jgi:hypothetical protein
MKRTLMTLLVLLFLLPMICAAQESISEGSFQASSENSSQESTGASSENSSQYSTEGSSQWSTDATSNSPQSSTDATTDGSRDSNSVSVALLVAGAVVSIALTVGGIILTVRVSEAKREKVLRLQDQIYLADGKDYQDILTFFKLEDKDLIKVNDQLVAGGYQIASNQDAADYLAALILALAERSEKVQYQLSVL